MSLAQVHNVPSLRERVLAAVAAREAEERERAEAADRNARGEAEARLVNRLRDILGIELAYCDALDWSGWPREQPTVTVERVTFRASTYLSHSVELQAHCPTDLPLEEWVPIRSLADLYPILAALDAAKVAR